MVASWPRGGGRRRGGDSDEVRRGDAMGREFWGCDDAGAIHRNRQVSAKARETLGDPLGRRVANQGAKRAVQGMTHLVLLAWWTRGTKCQYRYGLGDASGRAVG